MGPDGHFTYDEWAAHTVEKIVSMGLPLPEEHRADYLRLQISLALNQALRHGRSGRSNDEPVAS